MTTGQCSDRYKRLLSWMNGYDISFSAVAEQLGISAPGARFACRGETCPVVQYQKLRALGFPAELLPKPLDKPRGRHRKIPRFPAFAAGGAAGPPA